MLVLSRKKNESIVINGNIRLTVIAIRGNHVRLGIEAPESIGVFREELFARFDENQESEPITESQIETLAVR
ncbi:MAG: carbon storage regulator CsrA [Isosphaeraceae bacterium]